jgi:hypothetical protein
MNMNSALKNTLRRDVLVLLLFTVLTLAMTWPLIAQISTHYAGTNEDIRTFQWDHWWTRYALQHGYDLLFTPMQFYPTGVSLATHSLSFYNSIIWIPLSALFGDIAAYNMTVMLTFILSGYTMFKLADYLLAEDRRRKAADGAEPASVIGPLIPALIAGIIYAFAPYHFSQSLAHVSLASVQWFPLLALFIMKAAREQSRWNVIAIGVVTFLLTATRLQFLVLGAVVFAIFVLIDWLAAHRDWVRGAIGRLIVGAVLGLILSLPIALPAVQLYVQSSSPDDLIVDGQNNGQTDLLAYALPMRFHPILGPLIEPAYQNLTKRPWMPYLGYTTLALAILGVVRWRRQSLPWIAVSVFCMVMALGPALRLNGVVYDDVRLPYALIGDTFPLNTLRAPDRYNLLVSLGLAPLAAYGVSALLSGIKARAARRSSGSTGTRRLLFATGLVVAGFILFEYLGVPYPTSEPLSVPSFYTQIAADVEPYAILDIPLARSDTKLYLVYQILHQHPIVQGRIARVPTQAYALFDRIPLLDAWRDSISAKRPPDLGSQLAQLAKLNVRYIILHKYLTPPETVASIRNYFTRTPVFEDDQIAVYATDPITGPVTGVGGNIGLINVWLGTPDPTGPIRIHVRWTATAPINGDYAYRVALVNEAGSVVLTRTAKIAPATSSWQPGTIVLGDYELDHSTPVPPGRYQVQLSILDAAHHLLGAVDLDHQVLSGPLDSVVPWLMPVTEEPRSRFGGMIELRAADVSRRGNVVSLWLHWLALTGTEFNTKYFVQLLDSTGNNMVDVNAAHTTPAEYGTEWRAGQMLSDNIEIPVWNLNPGEYSISVGLINSETSERLSAVDSSGQPLLENRYVLSETIRIP